MASSHPSLPVWEWESNDVTGDFEQYDPDTTAQLEAAWQAGMRTIGLTRGWFASRPFLYQVCFDAGYQINCKTGAGRFVKRNGNIACLPSTSSPSAASASASASGHATNHTKVKVMDDCDAPDAVEELKRLFLSPKCCTDKDEGADLDSSSVPCLQQDEVYSIMRQYVPDVDTMMDRRGHTPVLRFIWSTYESSLPLYAKEPALSMHTRSCLRSIFHLTMKHPVTTRQSVFKALAEAYQSCQAEQARVINTLYGRLSGRDKGFREQVLGMVDAKKDQTMEAILYRFNGPSSGDQQPASQYPHIQSRYLLEFGYQLGLRGVRAAAHDYCMPPPLSPAKRQELMQAFVDEFSVDELLQEITCDINQQAPDASRLIDTDVFAKYVNEACQRCDTSVIGFSPHDIFYDEDNAAAYDGKPDDDYQPFVTKTVVRKALQLAFLLDPEFQHGH